MYPTGAVGWRGAGVSHGPTRVPRTSPKSHAGGVAVHPTSIRAPGVVAAGIAPLASVVTVSTPYGWVILYAVFGCSPPVTRNCRRPNVIWSPAAGSPLGPPNAPSVDMVRTALLPFAM